MEKFGEKTLFSYILEDRRYHSEGEGGDMNINNITLVKNNKRDVFAKIKHLIINKEKRVKMSKIARITAEKYYSCERMFKDYQKLF